MVEMRVPMIVDMTGSCESVSNVIDLRDIDASVLTQTGQLALEFSLEQADGVWCHTGSFRDEVVDARHLREFELVEEEISSRHRLAASRVHAGDPAQLFELLIDRVELVLKAMMRELLESSMEDTAALGGDPSALAQVIESDFRRLTYRDALRTIGLEPDAAWGRDLSRSDEEALLSALSDSSAPPSPTFVTNFPEDIKFFNMKADPDDRRTVLSVDLLLPGVGEAVGGAVRENHSEQLRERFERLMLPRLLERDGATHATSAQPFEPYFDAIRSGRVAPHTGYGLGLERVLSYVLKRPDIRSVSLPWMLSNGLTEGVS